MFFGVMERPVESISYENEAFDVQEDQLGCDDNTAAISPTEGCDNPAFKRDEPVKLISVKPIVEDAMIPVRTSDKIDDDDLSSKRKARNLSRYNWKHFLPVARR